jgi:hypothetical protein
VRRKLVAAGLYIEVVPTETWPVGEENRNREIRADLVMRLWRIPPPEGPSLEMIHEHVVVGLIVDIQNRADPMKEIRLLEYHSAYPPVLGQNIFVVVVTFDEQVAHWARNVLSQMPRTVQRSVITPRWIPRSGPIDPNTAPRRAMRRFSGNDLLIYRQMFLDHIDGELIMNALDELEAELQRELERELEEDLEDWADYEPTERERRTLPYLWGEQKGLEQGCQKGELLGRAHALLDVLRDRGFEPDPATEARILECQELPLLRRWLARAMTIDRLDALFDD